MEHKSKKMKARKLNLIHCIKYAHEYPTSTDNQELKDRKREPRLGLAEYREIYARDILPYLIF